MLQMLTSDVDYMLFIESMAELQVKQVFLHESSVVIMTQQGLAAMKTCQGSSQVHTDMAFVNMWEDTQMFYTIKMASNMVSQHEMTVHMNLSCNQIGLTSRTAGKDQLQLLFNVAAAFGFASPLAAAGSPLAAAASPAASQPPATAWRPGATAL